MPSNPKRTRARPKRTLLLSSLVSERLTKRVVSGFKTNPLLSFPLVRKGLESKRIRVKRFFEQLVLATEKGLFLQGFEKSLEGSNYKGPFYGRWAIHMLAPYLREIRNWGKTPEEYFVFAEKERKNLLRPRFPVSSLANFKPRYSQKALKLLKKQLEK